MRISDAINLLFFAGVWSFGCISSDATDTSPQQTVLVELFTSEGCSSCPPADRLLSKLARNNPNIIILGEHVDYWNSLGWKDPFSSEESTQRQITYCKRLGVKTLYTPQAFIDGKYQCVGSNECAITSAIANASRDLTVPVALQVSTCSPELVRARVSYKGGNPTADILLFLVQDGVAVDVAAGENGGSRLQHDGVVRMTKHIHNLKVSDVAVAEFSLTPSFKRENLRLVAVVEGKDGPCGAAQRPVEVK